MLKNFVVFVNPKVIQMLLGHKDVKTTIMNYNSVDQTYFAKTSNIINNSL
jgi:site-specific recombinase XerD